MPYNLTDNKPKHVGTLPAEAMKVWVGAYNGAYEYAKDKPKADREAYANQVAWAAMKKAGWRKTDNGWAKLKSDYVVFDMAVTKTSVDPQTGERRIRLSASDTGTDFYGEAMSLQLFSNFVKRIGEGEMPEPYKSLLKEKSGWCGGMPYASISHYRSGKDESNVPADIKSVYLDGHVLKSVAVVRNTPLGDALWNSLVADREGTSPYPDKIRVSIGFLDLAHSHGDFIFTRDGLANRCPMCDNSVGNKVYLDGILVHEAFTRKPANPRTDVEVLRMSDEILTREDDASSIVGESLAKELEVNKSTVDEVELVVKDATEEKAMPMEDTPKDEEAEGEHPADCTCKACAAKKKAVTKSELVTSFEALEAAIEQNKSLPRDEALRTIQPYFDALGGVVQKSFTEPEKPVAPEVIMKDQLEGFFSEMKSVLSDMATSIREVKDEVAILKSAAAVKPVEPTQVPAPRTAVVQKAVTPEAWLERAAIGVAGAPMTIKQLVERSTK